MTKLKKLLPIVLLAISVFLNGCTVNKLEARLEADPQCKPIINAKTGALMPCPGSDQEFYRSVASTSAPSAPTVAASSQNSASPPQKRDNSPSVTTKPLSAPVECKPALHQKSGSLMPCPAP